MAHKIILDFKERRNARKWKHEEGAKIHKPNGHRAITDNGWLSTKLLKNLKNVYGL